MLYEVITEYFNPSANDGRIAKAVRERPSPSIEQIRHVLGTMPVSYNFV